MRVRAVELSEEGERESEIEGEDQPVCGNGGAEVVDSGDNGTLVKSIELFSDHEEELGDDNTGFETDGDAEDYINGINEMVAEGPSDLNDDPELPELDNAFRSHLTRSTPTRSGLSRYKNVSDCRKRLSVIVSILIHAAHHRPVATVRS